MQAQIARAWFFSALILCAGCSAVVDPDTGTLGNVPPQPCVPGTTNDECACEDGRIGSQRCNEQERYGPCMCGVLSGIAGVGSGN